MFVATDDSTVEQGVDLTKEVEDLKANEEFYLGLKKRLEAENEALVGEKEELTQAKEEVDEYVAKLMSSEQSLRDDVRGLERKLADARDDIVRAGTLAKVKESTTTKKEAGTSQSESEKIMEWAKRNTTLIFPIALKARKPVILQDSGQQVKIPVPVGGSLKASRFHPTAPDYLVVSQPNSDKFRATMLIVNGNFIEAVKPKYESHMSRMGGGGNPLYVPSRKPTTTSSQPRAVSSVKAEKDSLQKGEAMDEPRAMGTAPVLTGKAKNPQKPANLLDRVSSNMEEVVDTSDHGPNCVCKDCRKKKIGKGGSLFPDL
jgi:hypothetical protein